MTPRKYWTTEEEAELGQLYAITPIEQLEIKFGTNWKLIKAKAVKLSLRRAKASYPEAAIITEYQNNPSLTEVLKKFNIGTTLLYSILRKNNIPLNKQYLIRPTDIKAFTQDYLSVCNATLCAKYNLSAWGVTSFAKSLGLVKPRELRYKSVPTLNSEQGQQIELEYITNHQTIQSIAKKLNVGTGVVYNYVRNKPWRRSMEKLTVMRRSARVTNGNTNNCYGKTQNEIKDWLLEQTCLQPEPGVIS